MDLQRVLEQHQHTPATLSYCCLNQSIAPVLRSSFCNNTILCAKQQNIRRTIGKDTHGNHTGDVIQFTFQRAGLHDLQTLDVENDVAVIGSEPLSQFRYTAVFYDFTRHITLCHRNHLDRQRKFPHDPDQFGFITDTDKLAAGRGDNLLAGQRATTALDQVQLFIGFVCAIDIDRQLTGLVQLHHRDAVTLQALGAGNRAGHGTVDLPLDRCKRIDKEISGRTGTYTDDGAGLYIFDGRFGNLFFQCILVHSALR